MESEDPIIQDYIEAYESLHGYPPIIERCGGWYRISKTLCQKGSLYRKKQLPTMAGRLRKMKEDKDERER